MPIIQLGFIPVPIDCDQATLNIMSDNLIERIRDIDLKVLFITNVLGFSGDLINIKKICDDNNIVFIGSSPEMITSMGDKATAKKTMQTAGVPVIPNMFASLLL